MQSKEFHPDQNFTLEQEIRNYKDDAIFDK